MIVVEEAEAAVAEARSAEALARAPLETARNRLNALDTEARTITKILASSAAANGSFTPRLTRLVIGAHDECIRVEISPCAFRYLKIEMWPREGREGCISRRHPTIEQAIESYRRTA